MLVEAFPRLAVRLRSTFPDADVQLIRNALALTVSFPNFPNWQVIVESIPSHDQFQIIQSSLIMNYDCLANTSDEDFLRLVAGENLGLRGATLIADPNDPRRTIQVRSNFIGQKGRTQDEAESLAVDVLSLLRFGRLLEDRIILSSNVDHFSYEMYYSQYLSKSLGRNRYINYARSIFQGSTERVFGQVSNMLREDYKYQVENSRPLVAKISAPGTSLEIIMRIPPEIPMITCCASLHACAWEPSKTFELVARLNKKVTSGHFEVNADGCLISFVSWKHLTNDLRYYSLDHMIAAVHEAQKLLRADLPSIKASAEMLKANATSMDAYSAAA